MKCPTCNRVIRQKKAETDEERLKRIKREATARISQNLRAPMPKATAYRD